MSQYHLENVEPFGIGANIALKLMAAREGKYEIPPNYHPDTVEGANEIAKRLIARGGFPQQERMVRDKRKTLDRATLYSYQACRIRKVQDKDFILTDEPLDSRFVRALINPDKNKFDYDNKILSVGFEFDFHPGDVFEWARTNSYWLITLQDLDEIAYFRGEIRRCDYQISWLDNDGNKLTTFASIRGPVETKINYIQKHQISVDRPNFSLHILLPRNEYTMNAFKRYDKFYLARADEPDNKICWRVEATDSISTVGILEITAVEYYANKDEDDIEQGLVGAFIEKVKELEIDPKVDIIGDSFIKCKVEYEYFVETYEIGQWHIKEKVPVTLQPFTTARGTPGVKLKWTNSYSGQFTLYFGKEDEPIGNFEKVIVVESLF